MPLQIDAFLLILRLLLIVLLYLFLMQVVIAITRDLRKTSASASAGQGPATLGHLVVVDSGPSSILPGTRFALAPQTNIGRGPTNTIQLPDKFISAEHTRLWYHNGIWYVQDAGSVNGTISRPAKLFLPKSAILYVSAIYSLSLPNRLRIPDSQRLCADRAFARLRHAPHSIQRTPQARAHDGVDNQTHS